MTFFKIKTIVIGLLTIFFFISPCNQAVADENPAGKIIRVEGTAQIIREGKVLEGLPDSDVYPTDEIKTGPDSLAELLFRDRSSIHLGPDSSLMLTQYKFSLKDDDPSFIAKMTKGIFVYISGAISKVHPGSVKFETPDGLIGIRGTKLVARIITGPDGQTTVVLLKDPDGHVGKVVFSNDNGETYLDKEFFSFLATLGQAPTAQVFMDIETLKKLIPPNLFPIVFENYRPPLPYTEDQPLLDPGPVFVLHVEPLLLQENPKEPESPSGPTEVFIEPYYNNGGGSTGFEMTTY
ncbi:MAG: FecR family protein [Pseudomonadota bacterium]